MVGDPRDQPRYTGARPGFTQRGHGGRDGPDGTGGLDHLHHQCWYLDVLSQELQVDTRTRDDDVEDPVPPTVWSGLPQPLRHATKDVDTEDPVPPVARPTQSPSVRDEGRRRGRSGRRSGSTYGPGPVLCEDHRIETGVVDQP